MLNALFPEIILFVHENVFGLRICFVQCGLEYLGIIKGPKSKGRHLHLLHINYADTDCGYFGVYRIRDTREKTMHQSK